MNGFSRHRSSYWSRGWLIFLDLDLSKLKLSPDNYSNQDDNGNILFFLYGHCIIETDSQFSVFSAVIRLFVVSMTMANWLFECKVWCELEKDVLPQQEQFYLCSEVTTCS